MSKIDYADNIFRYPRVQYIPLRLQKQKKFPGNFSSQIINISLYTPEQEKTLQQKLTAWNLNYNLSIKNNELALLTINSRVLLIKYRKHEVFLVGEPTPGNNHLFKITTEYFYEEKLLFQLYNRKNGNVLARIRKNIKKPL